MAFLYFMIFNVMFIFLYFGLPLEKDDGVARSIFLLEYMYSRDISHKNGIVLGNVSNNSMEYKLLEGYLTSEEYNMYWDDSLSKEEFIQYFQNKENDVQILPFNYYPYFYLYINGNRYFLSNIDIASGQIEYKRKKCR